MEQFYEEYQKIKDVIPMFLLTIQDTDNKIKLIHSTGLKVDETELEIYSEYIKGLNKDKVKKIKTIQKAGDSYGKSGEKHKEKNSEKKSEKKIEKKIEKKSEKKIEKKSEKKKLKTSVSSSMFDTAIFKELAKDLNERGDKMSQIEEKSNKLKNTSENYRNSAAAFARKYTMEQKRKKEKEKDLCIIF